MPEATSNNFALPQIGISWLESFHDFNARTYIRAWHGLQSGQSPGSSPHYYRRGGGLKMQQTVSLPILACHSAIYPQGMTFLNLALLIHANCSAIYAQGINQV